MLLAMVVKFWVKIYCFNKMLHFFITIEFFKVQLLLMKSDFSWVHAIVYSRIHESASFCSTVRILSGKTVTLFLSTF